MQRLPDSLKIGVIRGGISNEYDTSLLSGAHVIELLSDTHRPIDIFISKDGVWHMHGLEKSPEKILKNVDVVWNALHGAYGEDGKLQELLSHHGVKYTGSEKYPSSLAVNRWLTREHLKDFGIKTPTSVLVRQNDNLKQKSGEIFISIPHPLVVKSARRNSAIQTKLVKNYEELYRALYNILSLESDALVEEFIPGRTASGAVINNFREKDLYTLPVVETKYFKNGEREDVCPGNFTKKEKEEIEKLSALVHKHLGLRHYSQSNFIVSPKRGIYLLEVNTIPEFTKESRLTTALKSVGVSIKDFLHHIIALTL